MNKEYKVFWQLISTIYTVATVAIGLATTLYFAVSENTPNHAEFHELFFALLYAVGTGAIAALFWHARRSRSRGSEREQTQEMQQTAGDEDNNEDQSSCAPPDVAFNGEGFNVYLRIGLGVFLAGGITLNLLKVINQLVFTDSDCRRPAAVLMSLLEVAFTASQAAFIFSHHRAVFLRRKAQSRMALSHLFTANVCIWASAAIGEIKEQIGGESKSALRGNSTAATTTIIQEPSGTDVKCTEAATWHLLEAVQPFLTPAVIEYCLLAAPMVLHMLACVGDHRTYTELHRRSRAAADIAEAAKTAATTAEGEGAGAAETTLPRCPAVLRRRFAKSRRGLAFSVAAFAATAGVTVIVYQVLNGVAATAAYLVQDLLLSGIGACLCLAVSRQMRRLELSKCERHSFDDKLLTFALFGALVYQVTLVSVILDHVQAFPTGYLAAELVSLAACGTQLALQAYCLLDGLRRRSQTLAEVEAKPGRCLVLALLGVNLSMWIMETFEVRKAEELLFSYSLENVSGSALKIIIHIGQPINIFYRFHSTVCLSIIWRKAYERAHLHWGAEAK